MYCRYFIVLLRLFMHRHFTLEFAQKQSANVKMAKKIEPEKKTKQKSNNNNKKTHWEINTKEHAMMRCANVWIIQCWFYFYGCEIRVLIIKISRRIRMRQRLELCIQPGMCVCVCGPIFRSFSILLGDKKWTDVWHKRRKKQRSFCTQTHTHTRIHIDPLCKTNSFDSPVKIVCFFLPILQRLDSTPCERYGVQRVRWLDALLHELKCAEWKMWTVAVLEIRLFSSVIHSGVVVVVVFFALFQGKNVLIARTRYYNTVILFTKFAPIITNLLNELCKTFRNGNVSNNFEWNFYLNLF